MMKSPRSLLALLATTVACSAAPPPAPPPAPTAAEKPTAAAPAPDLPAPPTGLRLPRAVHPLRYAATLTLVPGDDVLRGEITIDLSLAEPTRVIWLHAEHLTVEEARIEAAAKHLPLRVVPTEGDLVGFALDAPAPPGSARLIVKYRGAVSSLDDHGAFREEADGASYIFSHFEATAARRVFPCIDDPGVKVPWQISLRVREADVALSNTPALGETKEPGGMKLVRFAPTPPVPSYLIAFAVGPFEIVDAGTAGKNKVPVRIAVPRGAAGKASFAAKTTPPLLGMLEEYLGTAYPYEKLDVVTIPRVSSFGAMENPGLVTYGARGSLAAPADETPMFRRGFTATMAHELAHQWFGNLVTMDFWEDIWLNEAFATWMGSKIVERFSPAWREDTRRVASASYAMGEDGLLSARKIRQEIRTQDDIANAFDSITYQKGAAVLRMFEAYVGPEKFQRGVRRYLDEHAHGNAKAADFLSALSAETSPEIGPAFATFLDQPGVPLVKAELSCEKGKPPHVKLSQSRWLPAGSAGAAESTWQIPVCLRYGSGPDARACTLLTTKTAELPLEKAKSCPAAFVLKDAGVGYYRVDLGKDALARLLGKPGTFLGLPERLALLEDASALVESGALVPGDVLSLVPNVVAEPDPLLERGAATLVARVRDMHVPSDLRPRFAAFITRTFGKRARALGVLPKPGEDEAITFLRPLLVSLVADRGEDPALLAELRALAARFLDDPNAAPLDVAGPALTLAARHGGDRALFDRLREAAKKERDERRRGAFLGALTSFRDRALVDESLALVLDGGFDPRDAVWLLGQDERMLDRSLGYVEKNWSALVSRMPSEALGYLPLVFQGSCDETNRAAVARVFEGRVSEIVGAPRALAQSLESISLCVAQRQKLEPSLRAFLQKY
ncbi:M1 family metallopeptidase [Polyangium sp. y55x31]|uniref:M1 family metallopeptidase n=1 Tax=Polyangium sp. y55x31 TaxID=3042688 RepID=UPI0024824939|nr:M1 family metallopeptidase [Polyangium sp. y55x31]MDI1481609.1 M1 family metallopeptidase [Polyangium sp. y55x31]